MQPFSYVKPQSLDEAIQALQHVAGSQAIAGGTAMVDLLKLDVIAPHQLVLLEGVEQLRGIHIDGQRLRLGAMVTMSEAASHPVIRSDYPVLHESLWKSALPQLRNVASVAGNLLQRTRCPYFRDVHAACNRRDPGSGCDAVTGNNRTHAVLGTSEHCIATYPGDWAVALVALDARVEIVGANGVRELAVRHLHRLPADMPQRETVLEPHELISAIIVPATPLARHSAYTKVRERRSYPFATTSAAVALLMRGNTVDDARIAVGGVATVPWRAETAEQSLIGQVLTEDAAISAGQIVFADARAYAHNAFKIPLGINTVAEALMRAARRH